MSELCPRFCPALRDCQRRIDRIQATRASLHELGAALSGTTIEAFNPETIAIDPDLAADIAENQRIFSVAYEGLFKIRQLQANCYGPVPNMRGRNLIQNYSSFNIHDELSLHYIYNESDCGSPEVQHILQNIPKDTA